MGCHFLLHGYLHTPEIEPMSPVSPAFAGRFFTCWAIREPLIHWALVFLFSEMVLIMRAASRLVLGIKWNNPLFFFWKHSKHSINGNHCYQHHYLKCMKEGPKDLGWLFVQSLSPVRLFGTPWTAPHQASLSFTISQSLLKLMSIESWCYPNISSSVIPFSCLQSFPESRSFLMSQLFTSGGQSIGASVSASVLLMNIQDHFPLGLTSLISWVVGP